MNQCARFGGKGPTARGAAPPNFPSQLRPFFGVDGDILGSRWKHERLSGDPNRDAPVNRNYRPLLIIQPIRLIAAIRELSANSIGHQLGGPGYALRAIFLVSGRSSARKSRVIF